MNNSYLLSGNKSREIYEKVKGLPIVDYHCHLSPKEIYEDLPFDNISDMWLSGDHYKWRLMRTAGIDERYITGDASPREKFRMYAKAIEFAAGNPLYHWSHMELSMFFGIDDALTEKSADSIYDSANEYIKQNDLSPRKLIEQSKVEVICTTDDIVDDLEFHKLIADDGSFATRVIPSYRTDNLLLVRRDGYKEYIDKLSAVSGVKVDGIASLKEAAAGRLQYFVSRGCRFTDVGTPFFPTHVSSDEDADKTFKAVLRGEKISDGDYFGFLGNMYLFLAALYKKYNLIMQWHLCVTRNSNSVLFERLGADCGVDCVGDNISGSALIAMLDAINKNSGLPTTVIYTLNSSSAEQIASIAGAFPNVHCGAAWWFCDHKRGIRQQLEVIAENSALGSFYGMLTDSRSFLSYARHDYFRRILCDMLGAFVENGEYDGGSVDELAARICYKNAKEAVENI